ncbi:phage tail sheath subtilisin-like domain-containing protein [Nocardioides conyzicola]|uniref:Phage tail sheath family protein n=1 Tax=Nocardioides conyzicola TaxID=1651781 RepID=A0ABP8XY87_9ACTN
MTYLSPGVYIEEVPSGPQPIAAAPTSVMAILGTTRKGPVLDPTRVTSWADYVRTFGAPSSRGFTGESVFGFFENGGPAAWVVRVDPSTASTWTVRDVSGAASFAVTALTPGAWSSGLSVGVAPDEGAATGTFYRATTSGATVAVTSAGTHELTVGSTAGLKPGDSLVLVPIPASGAISAPVAATVASLTPTTVTVSASGAASMAAGSVVATAAANGATTLVLANTGGFKVGDVVVATAPNGTRTGAVVTGVAAAGSGATLTLDAGLGAAVPGAAFVQRRTTYRAVATVAGPPAGGPPLRTNIALSALVFDRPLTAPNADDLGPGNAGREVGRITTTDGRSASWVGGNRFEVVGTTSPPSGPVTVEAAVSAVRLTDTGLSLTGLQESDALAAYGFLPTGAAILFSGTGPDVTATRTATGFTLAPAPAPADTYTTATFVLQATADAGIAVRSAVKPRVGDRLGIGTTYAPITAVEEQGGDTYVLRFAAATAVSPLNQTRFGLYAVESASVRSSRFQLTVSQDGIPVEQIGGLSLDESHPSYFAKDDVVNDVSAYVTVAPRPPAAPAVSLAAAPYYVEAGQVGSDRAPTNADFRNGLTQLEAVPEPAMVLCPDALNLGDPLLTADLVGQVVTHCENFRRFAIIDPPDFDADEDEDLLDWRNTNLSSTYAATYGPHLKIVNLVPESSDRFEVVPASGFVAGVFARTDRLRGVHKAPGNETMTGIVGLTQAYTQRRQDALNPNGVNLIRAFPGRGTRLWGARNATDDATWRYVNVRRLFNMIETSVDRATQWVVFEPNTAQTWIRVKVSIENFLDQQWRAGALAGTKPEQAYRVRVGLGETMTETDIDLGLIITEVAIAPAKPAEFVVFRFSHKRLSE